MEKKKASLSEIALFKIKKGIKASRVIRVASEVSDEGLAMLETKQLNLI